MRQDDKTRMVQFVDRYAEEQLRFVIDLCDQNSFTYHKAGTDRVAAMILDRFGGLFSSHHVVEQADVGDHHILRTAEGEKSIHLLGHMDTVFPPEHAFQSCRVEGDRLHGPGTGDMKGGLAVILYALSSLKEVGALEGLPVTVILSGDEEIGSATSHGIYEEERRNAIACIVTECAGLNGEIVISRNGKMGVHLICHGRDRHVGFGTHEKSSAVLEMAHKVVALEALNASQPGVSLNVGKVEGGLGPCTVPARAEAWIDVRWVEESHHDALMEMIEGIVSETHQTNSRSEFSVLNRRPAMPLTESSRELYASFRDAGKELGQAVGEEHRRGTSDANFFGSAGVPTLDGLGPVCDKDHTPDEYILIPSLAERTKLLAAGLLAMASKMECGERDI